MNAYQETLTVVGTIGYLPPEGILALEQPEDMPESMAYQYLHHKLAWWKAGRWMGVKAKKDWAAGSGS